MDTDKFANFSDSPIAPSRHCFAITPDDTAVLESVPKALFIGTGGTVTVVCVDGGEVTFVNLPNAYILDVRASHVKASGTTASDIVGLA